VLTECPSKPAQSPATTGCARLSLQPGHGRQAHPGLIGQLFLGQTPLPAELPKALTVKDERLRFGGPDGFTVGSRPGVALFGSHTTSISYQRVHPACSSPARPQLRAN
jgi:hypothetical protein